MMKILTCISLSVNGGNFETRVNSITPSGKKSVSMSFGILFADNEQFILNFEYTVVLFRYDKVFIF